jgi:hypothetical protein
MRVREKPKRFLPACPKKKPRTHLGPEKREKRVAGFLKAQREALPISSTSLVNRTQATFLALLTALGVFFNLSLAANSCLTFRQMASVSTL